MPSLVTYDQMIEVVGIALIAGMVFGVTLASAFSLTVGFLAWLLEKIGAARGRRRLVAADVVA